MKFYSNLAIEMSSRVREWTYKKEDSRSEGKHETPHHIRTVTTTNSGQSYKIGNEVPLKEFPCTYKDQSGTLYIGTEMVEHYVKILGFESKVTKTISSLFFLFFLKKTSLLKNKTPVKFIQNLNQQKAEVTVELKTCHRIVSVVENKQTF